MKVFFRDWQYVYKGFLLLDLSLFNPDTNAKHYEIHFVSFLNLLYVNNLKVSSVSVLKAEETITTFRQMGMFLV